MPVTVAMLLSPLRTMAAPLLSVVALAVLLSPLVTSALPPLPVTVTLLLSPFSDSGAAVVAGGGDGVAVTGAKGVTTKDLGAAVVAGDGGGVVVPGDQRQRRLRAVTVAVLLLPLVAVAVLAVPVAVAVLLLTAGRGRRPAVGRGGGASNAVCRICCATGATGDRPGMLAGGGDRYRGVIGVSVPDYHAVDRLSHRAFARP